LRYITLLFAVCCLSGSNTFAMGSNPTNLIQTPTARFNEAGTFSAGTYTVDSITGVYANYQWGDKAQLDIYKQKNSDIFGEDKYMQSIDAKFLINEESQYFPAIALGINSLNGDSFLESEYLAFSRKFYNWDFHTGMGWGRLGVGGHMKNPFSIFGKHFDQDYRDLKTRGETIFTGEKVALFGGVSYKATEKLKLKLEYNDVEYSDAYHKKRSKYPISFGADYNMGDFTISANLENSNKFMARLNYSYDTKELKVSHTERVKKVKKYNRNNINVPALRLTHKANAKDLSSYGASVNINSADLWIEFQEHDDAMRNALEASRLIYNNTGDSIKWLNVIQSKNGLDGVKSYILRSDLEKLDSHDGSIDKLIQTAIFSSAYRDTSENSYDNTFAQHTFIRPTLDLDLSQKHRKAAYRAYIIAGARTSTSSFNDLSYGIAGRLNLSNNMKNYWEMAKGRGTEDKFADNLFYLENLYARKTFRPRESLYLDLQMGYLEEMYYGASIEALYKPAMGNWGLSLNLDDVYQRKDYSLFGFYVSDDSVIGMSLYYEPESLENTLLKLSLTEYLGPDSGLSFSAEKKFNNGIKLKAFGNFSNLSEENLIVTESFRVNTGVKLSFPIGYGSKHNYVETNISPLGLISGESVNKPENLYNDLRDVSYNNLIKFRK